MRYKTNKLKFTMAVLTKMRRKQNAYGWNKQNMPKLRGVKNGR